MRTITSRQHPVVGRFRAAAARSGVSTDVLLDGAHLVREALASGVVLDIVATTASSREAPEIAGLIQALSQTTAELVSVSEQVLGTLSPVRTPTGIAAVGHWKPATTQQAFAAQPALIVVVAGVQDPGNLGAIIRAADAAGATGVFVAEGSASPFGWKALRGAMGSTFRLPIVDQADVPEVLREARASGIRSFATVPSDGESLYSCDLRGPALLLMGGEGLGLDAATVAGADRMVCIPMASTVESLNVAVAAGVMLFEARRQRTARQGSRSS